MQFSLLILSVVGLFKSIDQKIKGLMKIDNDGNVGRDRFQRDIFQGENFNVIIIQNDLLFKEREEIVGEEGMEEIMYNDNDNETFDLMQGDNEFDSLDWMQNDNQWNEDEGLIYQDD